MQLSDIPGRILTAFADLTSGTYRRDIPETTATTGAASWELGFPPITFSPPGSGGLPPAGKDVNGVLWRISQWIRWTCAGAPVTFDATYAAAVGGYPLGARVLSSTGESFWVSLIEDNETDPDAGPSADWASAEYWDNPSRAGTLFFAAYNMADSEIALECIGQSELVADHPRLFAAIGYTYGGSGLNFTLPDGRGRYLQGSQAGGVPTNDGVNIGQAVADQMQGFTVKTITGEAAGGGNSGVTKQNDLGTLNQEYATTGPISDGTHGTPRLGYTTRPVTLGAKLMIYR